MPSPSGGGRLVWTDRSMFNKLQMMGAKMELAISRVCEYEAVEAQNHMRTEAPWTDRTANARQGLFARSGRTEDGHYIVLYHTMPYGVWLELKNEGRYAIVGPSLDPVGTQVMRTLADLYSMLDAVA